MEAENTIERGGPRKRVIIVLAACVLVGVSVVAFWPGEREPEYNGKKLSQWVGLRGLYTSDEIDAVQHIGTNAVPFLLKWIQYEQPWWRQGACIVYEKLPSRFQRRAIRDCIRGAEPAARKYGAIWAFAYLGAEASDAVADLYVLALNPRTSETAFECLRYIGDPAVPALNRLTDAADERVRTGAFDALRSLAINRAEARPEAKSLLGILRGTEPGNMRDAIARALRETAPEGLTNGVKEF